MTEPSDQARGHGELGEEIQRLVSAAQQWAHEWTQGTTPVPPADVAPNPAHAPAASSCPVWCPICQFANVLRSEHPEVADRLADASTAIAQALRAFVDAAATRVAPGHDAATTPARPETSSKRNGEAGERPRPTPGLQRIHLDGPAEG